MSSEDHLEVLPLEWPFLAKNMVKIQRKWPKYETVFCFGHNFLSDAYFSIPFSQVSHVYIDLCIETFMQHIRGHIFFMPLWSNWRKWPKLPKIAVMARSDMAMNMVHNGFYAKTYINMNHLWKRNWKICIGSKVMAKTKSGVKFWPFPLYFLLFWDRKWPFQWE